MKLYRAGESTPYLEKRRGKPVKRVLLSYFYLRNSPTKRKHFLKGA